MMCQDGSEPMEDGLCWDKSMPFEVDPSMHGDEHDGEGGMGPGMG